MKKISKQNTQLSKFKYYKNQILKFDFFIMVINDLRKLQNYKNNMIVIPKSFLKFLIPGKLLNKEILIKNKINIINYNFEVFINIINCNEILFFKYKNFIFKNNLSILKNNSVILNFENIYNFKILKNLVLFSLLYFI